MHDLRKFYYRRFSETPARKSREQRTPILAPLLPVEQLYKPQLVAIIGVFIEEIHAYILHIFLRFTYSIPSYLRTHISSLYLHVFVTLSTRISPLLPQLLLVHYYGL